MAGLQARQRRATVFTYANLLPFIFFALFPFYFMLVTSFKSNAELYNLKSVPFLVREPEYMTRHRGQLTCVHRDLEVEPVR